MVVAEAAEAEAEALDNKSFQSTIRFCSFGCLSIIYYMKIISIRIKFLLYLLFLVTICFGQYEYSLEDVNPNSDSFGENVGPSYFPSKITLNYFGKFT